MARQINSDGEKLIKQWESFIPFAYDDFDSPTRRRVIKPGDIVKGTLTIGYGHTGPDVTPGLRIDQARADSLLRRDLDQFEAAVDRLVKVDLNDNQFAALVSFAFNCGVGNFQGSTLLKKLNAGNFAAVPTELMKWTKSKGKQMQGLVNRRSAEAGLWAKGSFVQSSGSVADPVKAPLVSQNALATGTALISGGALQYVPQTGPLAYALATVIVGAAAFLLWKYIQKRRAE